MIFHIPSHPGQFLHQVNPPPAQLLRRAYPGKQQQLRRGNRSGAKQDFRAGHRKNLAAACHLYPHRPLALKADAAHCAVSPDRQIQPMPAVFQVSQRGALADAAGIVQGKSPHPGSIGMVHIRILGKAQIPAGLIKGRLQRQPALPGMATHQYGAVAAVEIIPNIGIRFQFAEIRQDFPVTPFVIARRRPSVKILGQAAQKYLMIDGAGAAGYPPPGHRR